MEEPTYQTMQIQDMIIRNNPEIQANSDRGMKSGTDVSLKKLQSFDPDTIASVHNHYFPEIFNYAYYRTGDPSVAEDVASDALLFLLEAIDRGKGPKSSLRGWLMGTAANLVNAHFRRKYNRSIVELDENQQDDATNPLQIAVDRDEARTVRSALRFLTPEQQHVLALRFSNRYSLEETAVIMEKKVNAIKALQYRALTALRREIEKINQ